ncbi:MAG: heme ABC transporter ATP-binding protein [Rhizobiaceae bacterium]|nr:heme ABC transporter ATP-binding protein [Rhizobiaceae bacterium]
MIEARQLAVSLGGRPIVSNVDLAARAGEVTAIVGPNGSGKTTMLRALSGDLAYRGQITINGREVSSLKPPEAAAIRAVLPQATSLSFPFTVHEIVRLGLVGGLSGVSERERSDLPRRALERVDLAGFAGRLYQELSGGEQQRVQLARVLCQVWAPVYEGRARFLFLDEPVSSLDIRHQLVIMDIAREFAAAGGGVVAILHDLNLTAMVADHVVVMHDGRVAAAGQAVDVMRDEVLARVFGCELRVGVVPPPGRPFVLPQSVVSRQT